MFRHNGNFYFQKCWDLKADIERLERERDALKSQLAAERAEGERMRAESEVLRQWGNKDCTAMADEELAKRRATP